MALWKTSTHRDGHPRRTLGAPANQDGSSPLQPGDSHRSGGLGHLQGAGGPGRMVRGTLGLGDHPLAQPSGPPCLPTTFRRMEATSRCGTGP